MAASIGQAGRDISTTTANTMSGTPTTWVSHEVAAVAMIAAVFDELLLESFHGAACLEAISTTHVHNASVAKLASQ